MAQQGDVIVVGAGLAGLVTTHELVRAGKRVLVVEQENRANLRRAGVLVAGRAVPRRQPPAAAAADQGLARAGPAGLARVGAVRPRARGPLAAAVGHGIRRLRGGGEVRLPARPRPAVHARTWAGPSGVTAPRGGMATRCLASTSRGAPGQRSSGSSLSRSRPPSERGQVAFLHRHRVDEVLVEDGAAVGVRGSLLAPSSAARGVGSTRDSLGEFELRAQAVVVTSGGIGHNFHMIRQSWPVERLGQAARAHGGRRTGIRGRTHARDHRASRGERGQP